jgi:hypothetical protein
MLTRTRNIAGLLLALGFIDAAPRRTKPRRFRHGIDQWKSGCGARECERRRRQIASGMLKPQSRGI